MLILRKAGKHVLLTTDQFYTTKGKYEIKKILKKQTTKKTFQLNKKITYLMKTHGNLRKI